MAIQSVSKLDAATRQLHLAILLYFQDADALGVHTLAGAAHRLLFDLLVRRDGAASGSETDEGVQSTNCTFLRTMVNNAKNFLKHADRDHDQVLTFNTDWTDFLLYRVIVLHVSLTLTFTAPNTFFLFW